MFQSERSPWRMAPMILAAAIALVVLGTHREVGAAFPANLTNVNVLVTDAETGQPIFQARLTLQFHDPGMIRHKFHSFSAKTNAQGRYRFVDIPKGSVILIVTAERHQTFSKEFAVDKDNPLLEVKLKKPQDQL
jgi:hypothetical protein